MKFWLPMFRQFIEYLVLCDSTTFLFVQPVR